MARNTVVKASIIADASAFVKGVRTATAATDRFGRATKRAGRDPFAGMAKSALRAAAATASFYAVYDQGRKAVNETKDLAKSTIQLTRTTGLSTKEASRFVAITKVRGIEMTKLAASFTIFSKQILAANDGSEKAQKTFKRLGISQKELAKGDTRELFMKSADGLAALDNNYRKTALASQLFGRGYQALFPLLDMGGKGIAEQLQLAGDLGAELDGNGVEAFKKYAAAEREARLAVLGFRLQVGTYLIPKLTEAIGVFQQWVKEFKKGRGPIDSARDAVVGIYNAVKPLGELLINHPKLVMGAVAAYLTFKATLLTLNLYNAIMTALGNVGLYAASGGVRGAAFGAAFQAAMIVGLPVALTLIGDMISQKLLPKNLGDELGSQMGMYTGSITERFKKWGADLKAMAERIWGAVKAVFGAGKGGLGTIRAPKITGLGNLVSSVKSAVADAVRAALAFVGRFAAAGRRVALALAEGVKAAAAAVIGGARSVIGRALDAARGLIPGFRSVGSSISSGLAAGISGAVGSIVAAARNAIKVAQDAARAQAKSRSPSLVFAEIGEELVAGMAVGMRRTKKVVSAGRNLAKVAAASTRPKGADPYGSVERGMLRGQLTGLGDAFAPGLGSELADQDELLRLQYNASNVQKVSTKGKKGKSLKRARRENERRQQAADDALAAAERRQQAADSRRQAAQTIKDFGASLIEQIEQVQFDKIMAPVMAARSERAARQFRDASSALGQRISRGEGELNSPQAQARYARERTRLDQRIRQAERQGNLELLDDLYAQKEALDARYTNKYLTDLRDQLAELNENEVERTADVQAKAFANTFAGGITSAVDAFLAGGSVQQFFQRLTTALAGSGVTPGAVPTAGLGGAVGTIGGTTPGGTPAAPARVSWRDQITAWLRSRRRGDYNASTIARDLKTTKANVWANKPSVPGYTIKNRASGGRLGAMTLVGETGPELVVGNQVMSGTRTARLGGRGGTTNITINATGAAANNPQLLARELGWQLATR